jgi:hypothetical protein
MTHRFELPERVPSFGAIGILTSAKASGGATGLHRTELSVITAVPSHPSSVAPFATATHALQVAVTEDNPGKVLRRRAAHGSMRRSSWGCKSGATLSRNVRMGHERSVLTRQILPVLPERVDDLEQIFSQTCLPL